MRAHGQTPEMQNGRPWAAVVGVLERWAAGQAGHHARYDVVSTAPRVVGGQHSGPSGVSVKVSVPEPPCPATLPEPVLVIVPGRRAPSGNSIL